MNILRELRRAKKKSMATRVILISIFSVILIVNTYAWFSSSKNVTINGLEGQITSWDVAYYVDGKEILDQDVAFTIDELYPGMPNREDVVHIYNLGKTSTRIKYEIKSIKVYGKEVLDQIQAEGGIQTSGNTTNLFADDTKYPFNVSYTYDRTRLDGTYVDDESTPNAGATFKFNASWIYEGTGTADENEAKDILDTKFGKDAYSYYQNEANDKTKAIEIIVKITSEILRDST